MGADDRVVLVIGQHDEGLAGLTDRIRGLGYRARRIKTAEEALDLAQERGVRAGAIVIEPELPTLDLARAVATLRGRLADGRPDAVIAAGPRPGEDALEKLRSAHVTLGLFDQVGDHTLRFLLNRASTEEHLLSLRQDRRIPTEWRTLLHVGGRRKPTWVYSLSGGGAYLATPRPSQRGAQLALDLPLAGGVVSVAGRVLYTNVPGNLQQSTLPHGMGIEFVALPAEVRRAIEGEIRANAERHLI